MLNTVNIIGRLTAEPTLTISENKNSICKFTIACKRDGKDTTDFLHCICFGKTAENLCKYQSKGNLICVSGTLETYNVENENHKFTITNIRVQNLYYLEKKSEDYTDSVETLEEKNDGKE